MGIEPVIRGVVGKLGNQLEVLVELGNSARRVALGAAHHRDQKSALWQRVEFIGYRRMRRISGRDEPGSSRVRYVKKEDLLLSLQNTEESSATEHVAIAGQSHVMGLVSGGSRSGQRQCGNDLAIASG